MLECRRQGCIFIQIEGGSTRVRGNEAEVANDGPTPVFPQGLGGPTEVLKGVVHHAFEHFGRASESLGEDGSWTVIRDLRLVSSYSRTPPLDLNEDAPLTATFEHSNHAPLAGNGIVLHGRARIVNCVVDSFHFDGIHVETINSSSNA